MPENQQWRRAISRRQALALTGAAGVGTIAGCLGDDDDGSGDDGSGDDGSGGDDTSVIPGNDLEDRVEDVDYNENYEEDYAEVVPGSEENPYDGEYIFNPLHTSWNEGDIQETSFEYLAVFHAEDGFIPRVAEDWSHDQDSGVTTVTISDQYAWSDGSDITAQDFVTMYKLMSYMNQPVSTFVAPDGVRVTGDYEFEIEAREEYQGLGEDLWLNQWIEAVLHINHEDYGGFVEQFDDASEDEYESIQQEVVNFAPEWNQTKFSGPWVFVEANEEYADRVPNPGHPATDDWEIYLRTGQYIEEEGMRAEQVDYMHQQPTLENLPDIYEEAPVSYSGQSFAIIFGPDDDYIANEPTVRQALTHVVDFETLTSEAAPGTPVDTYQTGIDYGYVEQFVDGDVLDAMTNYAPADTDQATTLLEDNGFSLDDGTWYTPDDEEWEIEFPTGDWFGTPSERISNNLQEFGITMNHTIMDMPSWNSDHQEGSNYDMSVHLNYGQARQYHAHADLDTELFGDTRGAVNVLELFGEQVEVPEVGNPEGDMVTIDLASEIENLAGASDSEAVMEHSTNLAWAHNYLLPGAPVHPWSEHYWVNTGEWDFNLDSDAWVTSNRITHYFIQEGLSPQ